MPVGRPLALAVVAALLPVCVAAPAAAAVTIVCPDVGSRLHDVPAAARDQVDTDLAQLDRDLDDVNARLAVEPGQAESLLGVVEDRRVAGIDRIVIDITRAGGSEPPGLRELAACSIGAPPADDDDGNGDDGELGAPPSARRPGDARGATATPPPHRDETTPPVASPAPAAVDGGAAAGPADADPSFLTGTATPRPPVPRPAAAIESSAGTAAGIVTDPIVVIAAFVIALAAMTALTMGTAGPAGAFRGSAARLRRRRTDGDA